nr:unnamed protein product [Rangifer tarandus platyrhynchus]
MHSGGQGLPKASFLVLVLSLTIWNRDHAPEEEVWGTLSRMWLCAEGAAERSYPTSEVRGGDQEELPHAPGQGQGLRGAIPRLKSGASAERSNPTSKERRLCWRSRAERIYSLFKVRRGGREEIPLIQGKEQRLRFPGAAMKRHPTSKCD